MIRRDQSEGSDTEDRVVVVGASVAGSVAALRLARAGIPVTVLERRAKPYDKICGEGLHPAGLAVIEELVGPLERNSNGHRFSGFQFRTPETSSLSWGFPTSFNGLGICRKTLSERLRDTLGEHPLIELQVGVSLKGLSYEDDKWKLASSVGEFTARHVIAADGVMSRVRHWAHLERGKKYGRWGARRRYRLLEPLQDRVTVQFLGRGEVYLTPLDDDRLSVAALGRKEWILSLRDGAEFDRILGEAGAIPAGAVPLEKPGVLPHQGFRSRSFSRDGLFLAGDAALFLDPISGAGMTLAALGGSLAATSVEALRQGSPLPAVEKRYARELKRAVRPFRNLERFLRLAAHSGVVRRAAIGLLPRMPWLMNLLGNQTLRSCQVPSRARRDDVGPTRTGSPLTESIASLTQALGDSSTAMSPRSAR